MSYARFWDSDVYIYASTNGGLTCCMCHFGDMMESFFYADSTQEMVDHLKAHERVGDRLPPTIYDDLWRDDLVNFPRPVDG
jgi:hypothetical protein